MISKSTFYFWLIIWVVLTLLFSTSLQNFLVSFYFVTILMPIAIATSVFFNRFLVPRYLLVGKKLRFSLYLAYMIIVSIYLELLVMVLAFVILADYQFENLGKIAGDIYLLTIVLYLVVLVEGLILSVRKLREKSEEIASIQNQLDTAKQAEITVRANRKSVVLALYDITYIESLGDYVQIHTVSDTTVTKEKISNLSERLPSTFVRIHRSFIVNRDHVVEFNKEEVQVGSQKLSIGRKFKRMAEEQLKADAIV